LKLADYDPEAWRHPWILPMHPLRLSALNVYPIKSAAGLSLEEHDVDRHRRARQRHRRLVFRRAVGPNALVLIAGGAR
jgi:hypothetical protein